MIRRWLAVILALLMVVGTVGIVAAEEVDEAEEELQEEEGPPDFVIEMKELKAQQAQQKGDDMEDEEDEDDEDGPPDFVLAMKAQKFAIMSKTKLKIHGNPFVSDLPPVIKEGRTLIPVGAVVKSLGAKVHWDEVDTVTIEKGDTTIKLVIGENSFEIFKNGSNEPEINMMDTEAQILGNRTFVPLKFIAEALGEKVKWNPEDKSINIGREFGQAIAEEARTNDDDADDADDEDDEDDAEEKEDEENEKEDED